jgi:valyl-tRNA synthetase
MDTWNTSSLTPYICYNLFTNENPFPDNAVREFIPMSMRPQAHDIIRTWAFDTIVKVWMHNNTLAWQDIVISGHVLSSAKEKLSKSKGEKGTTPEALLTQYPADAIRYWTASGSLGYDTAFSDAQLKIGQRLITKLWNAGRFIKEHTKDVPSATVQNGLKLGTINEWLLHEASICFTNYDHSFKQYEFSLALERIEKFFWHAFCDNYLELIKHQLFNPQDYSQEEVATTKATLYYVGLRILQLYAPFIPHVTERLYQEIYTAHLAASSLHQTQFADIQFEYTYPDAAERIAMIIGLVTQVRKLKTTQQLSLKTPLQTLTIYAANDAIIDFLKTQEKLLRGISQALTIQYTVDSQQLSSLKQDGDFWHAEIYVEK